MPKPTLDDDTLSIIRDSEYRASLVSSTEVHVHDGSSTLGVIFLDKRIAYFRTDTKTVARRLEGIGYGVGIVASVPLDGTCPECGGVGGFEVSRGYRATGSGYGDVQQRWRQEQCTICDGTGSLR